MSTLFHPIRVSAVIKETRDASTIVFDIPENLKSQFQYKPGQYITISLQINGKEERRAYSFSSSPLTDHSPAITVKKVKDGMVSPYLNDTVKANDIIQLMPPMGKFIVEPNEKAKKHYLLYAGGSGITPVMSILKSVLKCEPLSKVSLIYANRNAESIIFLDVLNELLHSNPDRLKVYHCLEEGQDPLASFRGRPSMEDYKKITSDLQLNGWVNEYLICGPGGMMEAVKNALQSMGIQEELIHTEYFTAPVSSKEPIEVNAVEEPFTGLCHATVLFNGASFEIEIPEGVTVLEAAKDQDVDPPYACQMGVCTTCRAKLIEGKVNMIEREGLSDSEINAGFILTCQSHPITSKIKLIYE